MAGHGLVTANGLGSETMLFRYISLSQFVSFVESGQTHLSKVREWRDTWELPTSRLPTLMETGELEYPLWSISEETFGQSWSLLSESDAMWRIYSPQKEGLMIQSSVSNFVLFDEIRYGLLAPVVYYQDLREGINELKRRPDYVPLFAPAFLKRRAFEHEHEVRLVTANDERCLGARHSRSSHIQTTLDPLKFIEAITVDPRGSDWYVEAIQMYCRRVGFSIEPRKSELYSTDVFGKTGLVQRWVPVDRNGD